jgi:flagellar motility protein MotE (MotC chaperone)
MLALQLKHLRLVRQKRVAKLAQNVQAEKPKYLAKVLAPVLAKAAVTLVLSLNVKLNCLPLANVPVPVKVLAKYLVLLSLAKANVLVLVP